MYKCISEKNSTNIERKSWYYCDITVLCETIEKVTWRAFSKLYRKEKYSNVTSLHNFALELLNKSERDCKRYYEKCKEDIKILQQDLISI